MVRALREQKRRPVQRIDKSKRTIPKGRGKVLHVMVDDVVSAKNARIPEKLPERRHVAGVECRAVRAHGADVMNPPVMNADLQINEHNFIVHYSHFLGGHPKFFIIVQYGA